MIQDSNKKSLATLVDKLWKTPSNKDEFASGLVPQLTDNDWLILAGWNTAACFGPISGILKFQDSNLFEVSDAWGKITLRAAVVDSLDDQDRVLIKFQRSKWSVVALHDSFGVDTILHHSPVSLLLALEMIRDHLDSALLAPKLIREARLKEFSSKASLSQDHFRRLASWYSSIREFLEA